MTRAQAAEELRGLLGEGDASPLGEALAVAIRALSPAVRKATRAPMSRHVRAFLRSPRPSSSAEQGARARYDAQAREGWAQREASASAEVRAQFEGRVRVTS